MIDGPPPPPPAQVIVARLGVCGLDRNGVSVTWHDEFESYEVVIRRQARATAETFPCLHDAAATDIVSFEDPTLQTGYDAFTTALSRPRMIADARAEIVRLGLLETFPKRSDFHDLADYARALERHCGLAAGGTLRVSGDSVTVEPDKPVDPADFERRYAKVLAALIYAAAIGEIEGLGFIGNEKAAASDR